MSKEKTSAGGIGIGFCEALGLIFVVLKLVGVIDWSWWLVLLPIYGPIALAILIILCILAVAIIKNMLGR